jgi:transcriptional regulator with XRE-family HTH domain
MNTLMIGDKILKLRKEKAITQEQLSNMVGVSAGAVCKWETGNSIPDITLLAPLARALGITIDELLSFTPELSEDEVRGMKQELSSGFTKSGYTIGEAKCKKLLLEYPNSIFLKLTIAELIQMYAMMYANESDEIYHSRMDYALSLLQNVVDSKETKYISQGLFAIAGIHMILENYNKSETVIKQLLENHVDPLPFYAIILQKQGKNDEAKLLCEQILLSRLSHCTSMLTNMSKISIEEKNQEYAFFYLETIQKLEKIFGIGLHSSEYQLCKLFIKTKQLEPAAKIFKTYIEGLLSTDFDYHNNQYFKDVKLEIDRAGQISARKNMYQSHIIDPLFKEMSGLQDYEDAIKMLKNNLD